MAKVKDVIKKKPKRNIHLSSTEQVDPGNLWSDHDDILDSLLVYITGQPVRSFSSRLTRDISAMVDTRTRELVGFMVCSWDKKYANNPRSFRDEWLVAMQELARRTPDNQNAGDIDKRLFSTFLHLQGDKAAPLSNA